MEKTELAKLLSKAIALPEFTVEKIEGMMEIPPKSELGNFAFPCFLLAKELKKNPQQIAQELSTKIPKNNLIGELKVVGPYLNFYLSEKTYNQKIISEILKQDKKFGTNKSGKNQKFMLEYASPNLNKPLTLGHLRNMAIAVSLANLYSATGHKLITTQILNDRGIHISKAMVAYEKFAKNSTPEKVGEKSDHFIGKFYVQFSAEAEKNPELEKEAQENLIQWEAGEKKNRALWKKVTGWAEKGINQTYKEFGASFDKNYYESKIYSHGKEIVQEGLKKGIFEKEDNGAISAPLEKYGMPKKILQRGDGTSIYITQDLYLAMLRFKEFKLNGMGYVVASEQNLHFKQVFKILELLGFKHAGNLKHVSYGLVTLPEGGKMKSRAGRVVYADDLMEGMVELAKEELTKRYPGLAKKELDKRSKAIGIGAIKFYLLHTDAAKDIVFDPAKTISFDGETGPFVQYTYARANSILRKAKVKKFGKIKYDLLNDPKELQLISVLSRYPEVVEDALKVYSPHKLTHYMIELSNLFNSYYHSSQVIQENKDLQNSRLALVEAVRIVLGNGLALIGMTALSEM